MPATRLTFDAMARQFDDTTGRARATLAAVGRADEELAGLLGRARSPDGDAEAVVDGRGALVSLRLAESVALLPTDAVGALIVSTAHAAALDAMNRRARLLGELVEDLGR